MNPKISVIVPVYKAEKYLHRCVDSILGQTFSDFEVLLIDDGSPDRSGEICDGYAKKDSRVRVFHKENGGVTMARKLGVEHSMGEWITFVDSDDYLYEYAFKTLITHIGNVDMVTSCIEDNKKIWSQKRVGRLNKEELIKSLVKGETYGALHATLFHRKLFSKETFSCPSDIKIGEDVIMKLLLASKVQFAININKPIYFYYTNDESVMNTKIRSILYYIRYNNLRDRIIGNKLSSTLYQHDLIQYLTAYYSPHVPYHSKYHEALETIITNCKYTSVIKELSYKYLFLFKFSKLSYLCIILKIISYYVYHGILILDHTKKYLVID